MQSQHTINGAAVHTVGTGPAIVLLHANGGSHRDYEAIIDDLSRQATVHAIDWPGHGASEEAASPTACGFADMLADILDQLGGGPFTLIGNSVGGFAALRTASRRPDLVRALVLIDTGGFTPRWPTTYLGCQLLGTHTFAPIAMRTLPRLYLRTRTPAVEAILERAKTASRDPERVRTFAAMWRSFIDREHDARSDAASIDVPTLLVWGSKDPVLPWRVDGRRALRALPEAKLVTFRCGHQPYAEMPAEFLAALTAFLPVGGETE